jgi:hypothetical protein
LLAGQGRHSLVKLPFPIVELGIAQAEGEHGVGQLLALPVAGVDSDEDGTIVAPLNVPGIELSGVHGVSDGVNWQAAVGTVPFGNIKRRGILPETAAQF